MRDSRKYADLTADDLCDHEGGRTITTQGTFAWNPEHAPGTALLLCDDCGTVLGYAPTKDQLEIAQDAADIMANVTGSVSATHRVESRTGGKLVVTTEVVSHSPAQRQAIREARQAAAAEAARQETEAALRAALEANVWSAWADTSRAADAASCQLARLAEANDPQAVTMMNALDQMRLAEAALNAALGLLAGKAGA